MWPPKINKYKNKKININNLDSAANKVNFDVKCPAMGINNKIHYYYSVSYVKTIF